MLKRELTCRLSKQHYTTVPKLKGYDFFNKTLGSPKYIVGPMVEQSELSWRILSRRYNAHLCYTPMFHAKLFSDPIHGYKYRDDQWTTNAADRPLIIQFCANDPETLLTAAKMVEHQCEAVDLNLGCPQYIAKRGRYGSFLQDDWDLIHKLISTLDNHLQVPVTAKIRVFPSVTKTVEYAKMLVAAGAQLLTVHGRLREQKGHHTGLADWTKIKAVKEAINVPVIANGNILYHDDVQHCLEQTGADGVMSAEGHLYNPAIFHQPNPPVAYDIALEYLEICKQVATRYVVIKSHLFKLFHTSLPMHTDLRNRLGVATSLNEMENIVLELKERLLKQRQLAGPDEDRMTFKNHTIRKYAPWRCQPFIELNNNNNNSSLNNEIVNERRQRAIKALAAKKKQSQLLQVK